MSGEGKDYVQAIERLEEFVRFYDEVRLYLQTITMLKLC